MAFDKVIDSAKLESEITATANAIREKTGTSEKIQWEENTGFAAAVDAISAGGSDVPFTTLTVTATRAGYVLSGASVTAVNGSNTLSGVTGTDGKCKFIVTIGGTWSITVTKDGGTYTTTVSVTLNPYSTTATLFYATIAISCETGATISLKNPDGSVNTKTTTSEKTSITVYSSGTYTATVTYNGISKEKEITVSTTSGATYKVNLYVTHLDLEATSWEQISAISNDGNAANYFSVGDTKSVKLNGTVGGISVNATYYVYIIGINHNSSFEGNGIHFGCFKTANGTDIALVNSTYYGYAGNGFRHSESSNGELWGASYLRKNILGSTGTEAFIKNQSGLTEAYSTDQTLLGAIPPELLNVVKPVKKYFWTRNLAGDNGSLCVKDKFTLLSHYEITGVTNSYTNASNNKYATYCRQYEYYASGASKVKYRHNAQTTACIYWLRDQGNDVANYGNNICVDENGNISHKNGSLSYGLAPIFVV